MRIGEPPFCPDLDFQRIGLCRQTAWISPSGACFASQAAAPDRPRLDAFSHAHAF
jgi:hypothetical protein